MLLKSRYPILIAVIFFIAMPVVLNAETTDCKQCNQKQLHTLANRLIAYSKHANESISHKEYRSLKDLILTPEMKFQINKIEANNDLLCAYATLSEERKLDLPGTYCVEYFLNDNLLLTPVYVKSKLSLKELKIDANKAEMIMLRKVNGDDSGKVWRPYQEELKISFECVEGRWILIDIQFDNLTHPVESDGSLKMLLTEIAKKKSDVLKEWEPRVEAALSKAALKERGSESSPKKAN